MGGFLKPFCYGLILAGAGWFVLTIIGFSDVFKIVHGNVPGPCNYVGGIEHGSEDIAVLPNGIAILSTGAQWPSRSLAKDVEAAIMTFNFSSPDSAAKKLSLVGFSGHLNPHGVSLYTEGGKTFVYIINHPPFNEAPPSDVVLKFQLDIENQQLIYQETFSDDQFLGLNDLVVVGMDKFYITNLMSMTSKMMRKLETLLLFPIPLQNIVYFDGKKGLVVVRGMFAPNGINISPDKKFIYVAEVNKKRISSYKIVSPTELVFVDSKALGSIPDNIDVDPETGDVWIGCHPVGFEVLGNLFFKLTKRSPSQVLRVGAKDGKFTKVVEVYANDGSMLSAASVAVPYKDSILVGTVNHKVLHCKCVGQNCFMKLE